MITSVAQNSQQASFTRNSSQTSGTFMLFSRVFSFPLAALGISDFNFKSEALVFELPGLRLEVYMQRVSNRNYRARHHLTTFQFVTPTAVDRNGLVPRVL